MAMPIIPRIIRGRLFYQTTDVFFPTVAQAHRLGVADEINQLTVDRTAVAQDCPLRALVTPGLDQHPELLDEQGSQRLVQLVAHYIECSDRHGSDVEIVARAGVISREPLAGGAP